MWAQGSAGCKSYEINLPRLIVCKGTEQVFSVDLKFFNTTVNLKISEYEIPPALPVESIAVL